MIRHHAAAARSTPDLAVPLPSPIPLGPLPPLPTSVRPAAAAPGPIIPSVVLYRASIQPSPHEPPVSSSHHPSPSARSPAFSVTVERSASARSVDNLSLSSFIPELSAKGLSPAPSLQHPPPTKVGSNAQHSHKRTFSLSSWTRRDPHPNPSRETLQVVGRPRKVPYDYTSWRAPSRFERTVAACRPAKRSGKTGQPSRGLRKSTSFIDLPGTRTHITEHRPDHLEISTRTRHLTAQFTIVPLGFSQKPAHARTMSIVQVLPLPADFSRAHHGPAPAEASGTGYLAWAAKGARYIPYASYLLGTVKTGPVSLKESAPGKRATSPEPSRGSADDDAAAKLLPQLLPLYFTNPWPSWRTFRLGDAYKAYQKGTVMKPAPAAAEEEDYEKHGRLVKVVRPQWGESVRPSVCWLGHASTMVRIPWGAKGEVKGRKTDRTEMAGVLFDPIFSKRCSPSQWLGPARSLDPPCDVDELPPVHVVCISHDHYDHLDYDTIKALYGRNRYRIHFFVPLGVKNWFVSCNIPAAQVTELDWFQESLITIPASATERPYTDAGDSSSSSVTARNGSEGQDRRSDTLTLKIVCTPAQHRSGRGIFDQMKTLWSSWVVGIIEEEEAARKPGFANDEAFRMFFGGDTGYRYAGAPEEHLTQAVCPAFSEIAERYGPMTLSLLPISTGSSFSFLRMTLGISLHHYSLTSPQHSNAWDALQIAKILGSKSTVAIHHSTFSPEDESRGCIYEFNAIRHDEDVPDAWGEEGCFVVADVGEILEVGV